MLNISYDANGDSGHSLHKKTNSNNQAQLNWKVFADGRGTPPLVITLPNHGHLGLLPRPIATGIPQG